MLLIFLVKFARNRDLIEEWIFDAYPKKIFKVTQKFCSLSNAGTISDETKGRKGNKMISAWYLRKNGKIVPGIGAIYLNVTACS